MKRVSAQRLAVSEKVYDLDNLRKVRSQESGLTGWSGLKVGRHPTISDGAGPQDTSPLLAFTWLDPLAQSKAGSGCRYHTRFGETQCILGVV